MKDTEVFAMALGLGKPWRVQEVRMEKVAGKVVVEIGCEEGTAVARVPWAGEKSRWTK